MRRSSFKHTNTLGTQGSVHWRELLKGFSKGLSDKNEIFAVHFRRQSYAKQDEPIHPPEQLFACILAEKWVCSTQLSNGCWVPVKAAPSHLVVHLLTPGVPFVPLSSFTAFARQFLAPQFLQSFGETSSLVTVWLHWRTVPLQLRLDLRTAIFKSAAFKNVSQIVSWSYDRYIGGYSNWK